MPSANGSSPQVLVTGSIAFDHIMDFPGHFKDHILPEKLHVINISFLVEKLKKQRGGCAANIAFSLAKLGGRPRLMAAVGHDFDDYRRWLLEQGIDVGGIKMSNEEITASCFITTDRANSQITGFFPGAMAAARELSIVEDCKDREFFLAVVAPDDPDAMVRHCREAKEAGIPLMFDPSFQVIAFDGETLAEMARGARFLILNDYEYSVFQEKTGYGNHDIFQLVNTVIVTLGKEGCQILQEGAKEIRVPAAESHEVIDPTGAGDAFRGGFVAGLSAGCDYETSAQLGTVASVYAIESYGTSNHTFTRREFADRFEENFGTFPLS